MSNFDIIETEKLKIGLRHFKEAWTGPWSHWTSLLSLSSQRNDHLWEIKREKDRQTDRQTDTKSVLERESEREREREKVRQTDSKNVLERERQRKTDRHTQRVC